MRIARHLLVPAVLSFGCAPLQPPPSLTPAENPPRNWHLLDPSIDHIDGISAERAYRELLKNRTPTRTIVVAVLDLGVDTAHPALRPVLWTNPGEIPGNNIDDDHNGYVDDVHGWNYVGGKDGRNLEYSSFEITRLYGNCIDSSTSRQSERPANCAAISDQYSVAKKEFDRQVAELSASSDTLKAAAQLLHRAIDADSLTRVKVAALKSSDPAVQDAQRTWIRYYDDGWTEAVLPKVAADRQLQVRYWMDPHFDASKVVGDNPNNWWEHDYGNNDVNGPSPTHGSHVAGIIAALPGNGVSGIARGVRIMSVRAGCECDERDKDVANAIRYAVDNGANIINMSFGKGYSPEKVAVDSAVKYADSKGVLLVHAAGNGSADLAVIESYPNARYRSGGGPRSWIEVGSSTWKGADTIASRGSNYGAQLVDVFAPGSDVYSTYAGGGYERLSGTSMAAPMVAGIAAVLMQYYPELTARDVKRIILASATRYPNRMTIRPGTKAEHVPFAQLSATGGIANLYAAIRLADTERQKSR